MLTIMGTRHKHPGYVSSGVLFYSAIHCVCAGVICLSSHHLVGIGAQNANTLAIDFGVSNKYNSLSMTQAL